MTASLASITPQTITSVHPDCLATIFWETDAATRHAINQHADIAFEKEAWITRILLERTVCGYNMLKEHAPQATATILYCPAASAPGCADMPTGPVSDDAELVTSIFTSYNDYQEVKGDVLMLLSAVACELQQRGVKAVEIFGYKPMQRVRRRGLETDNHSASDDDTYPGAAPLSPELAEAIMSPHRIGLLDCCELIEAGFTIVADHPLVPRLRLELPPRQGLLAMEGFEDMVADNTAPESVL